MCNTYVKDSWVIYLENHIPRDIDPGQNLGFIGTYKIQLLYALESKVVHPNMKNCEMKEQELQWVHFCKYGACLESAYRTRFKRWAVMTINNVIFLGDDLEQEDKFTYQEGNIQAAKEANDYFFWLFCPWWKILKQLFFLSYIYKGGINNENVLIWRKERIQRNSVLPAASDSFIWEQFHSPLLLLLSPDLIFQKSYPRTGSCGCLSWHHSMASLCIQSVLLPWGGEVHA